MGSYYVGIYYVGSYYVGSYYMGSYYVESYYVGSYYVVSYYVGSYYVGSYYGSAVKWEIIEKDITGLYPAGGGELKKYLQTWQLLIRKYVYLDRLLPYSLIWYKD